MTLPEIQERLHELADALLYPLLLPIPAEDIGVQMHHLADSISRRKAISHAPVSSRPMTPELAEAIRQDKAKHPKLTYQKLAERHGVNTGRVSEALRGKRT